MTGHTKKGFLKNTLSEITEHDMFGYVVSLNINKKGDSHKTIYGGCCSIMIKITICFYIWLLITKIINNSSTVGSAEFLVNAETSEVNYDETHFMLTPLINKVRNGHEHLKYDKEAKKYIEIRFS